MGQAQPSQGGRAACGGLADVPRGVGVGDGGRGGAEVGAAILRNVNRVVQAAVQAEGAPGAAAFVSHRAAGRHFARDGVAGQGLAFGPDTVVRCHSLSRVIVSLAVMRFVDRGDLGLNEPIYHFLGPKWRAETMRVVRLTPEIGAPEWERCQSHITIKQLLTHTSGLPSQHPEEMATLEDRVERLASEPLLFQPGERFLYSVATDVLGLVLERIAKAPLDQILKTEVLDQLGMHDTGFDAPPGRQIAAFFELDAQGAAVPLPDGACGPTAAPTSLQKRSLEPTTGLFSSVGDLAKLGECLANRGLCRGRRLLSERAAEMLCSNQLPGGKRIGEAGLAPFPFPNAYFGLGVIVCPGDHTSTSLAPAGAVLWAAQGGTFVYADPHKGLSLAFAMQVRAHPSTLQLIDRAVSALHGACP